ncbi:MAG: hypothetical protein JWN61_2920 [Pseudonocardiales bacterium]|nr:hypothetical protein [Pseudonocardiales bacterium]
MPAAAEKLRKGGFIRAIIALLLAFCVEIGATFFLDSGSATERVQSLAGNPDFLKLQAQTGADPSEIASVSAHNPQPPGLAISYLALIDGLLLLMLAIMVLNILISQQTVGRLQGIVTLILMIFLIIACIVLAIFALIKLVLMVTLFISAPFGTLAYLVLFGNFDTGGATFALAAIMALKLTFCLQLVLGQQRFLALKGFVALIATSLLCTLLVGFLHGIVPSVLTSITDALAALIIAIIALIWAIVLLVGAAIGTVKAIA